MNLLENLPDKLDIVQEKLLVKKIQKHQREEDITQLALCNMEEAFLYTKKCNKNPNFSDGEIFSMCYKELVRNAKRFRHLRKGIRFFGFCKMGLRCELIKMIRGQFIVKNKDSVPHETFFRNHELTDEDWTSRLVTGHLPCDWKEASMEFDFSDIDSKETWEAMKRIMVKILTERDRMIIELIYMNGFNLPEVASMLGISRSNVQKSRKAALEKLRSELRRNKSLL